MKFFEPLSIPFRPLKTFVLTALLALAGCNEEPVGDVGEYISEAQGQYASGQYPDAVILLKNALSVEPQNLEARFLLGQSYLKMGLGDSAEKELRKAKEAGVQGIDALIAESLLLQGKDREVIQQINAASGGSESAKAQLHALRGNAYLIGNLPDAASREYEKAVALHPENAVARVGQAMLAELNGDVTEARSLLQSAVELDPEYALAWSVLGNLERRHGLSEAAEAAYDNALANNVWRLRPRVHRALIRIERDDFEGAEEDIAALERFAQGHPDVAYIEGRLSLRREDFVKAEAQLARADESPSFAAVNNFYLGAAKLALGQHEQAAQRFERFLNAYPGATEAGRLLAYTYLQLGNPQDAETLLSTLLRAEPENPDLLHLMSQAKIARDDHSGASDYLRKVSDVEPDAPVNLATLGLHLLRVDETATDEALDSLNKAVALAPTDLNVEIALVTGHLQQRNYDEALKITRSMQSRYPENPHPWTLAGIAYGAKKDFSQATSAFEKALELAPGEPSASANLAAIALHEGDIDRARGYYRGTLEHFPEHLQTLISLARLEATAGNIDAFLQLVRRAITAHPRDAKPRILLAKYHGSRGEPVAGIETLKEISDTAQHDTSYLMTLGQLQMVAGEYANAVNTFSRLVDLEPDSAESRYWAAEANAAAKYTLAFEENFLEALRLDPKHRMATPLSASYLNLPGTLDEIEARSARIKEIDPENVNILYFDAKLALQGGDIETANSLLSKGADLRPSENRWAIALSQVLQSAGRAEEAESSLTSWLSNNPQDKTVLLELARRYVTQGRTEEAQAATRKLVELAPGDPGLLNDVAWVMRTADPAGAIAHAERAVELTGGANPNILDTLGTVLFSAGQNKRALEVLKQAVEADSSNPTFGYHYAMALEQDGQIEEARNQLEQVLSAAGPAFQHKAEAEATLDRLRQRR